MNELKYGFRLTEEREVPELKSRVFRYEHEKSGAELLYMQNDDQNKVFGISFRTPQENSTGVPHIIEHCVLNGSRKFKTKEPFMDLARSSLSTFLNAMTFSDKTIYPIASRNDQDFHNLMDVYLDAVFYPVLHEEEKVFLQEGWRYAMESPDADLAYSGVVYNEMRGAYSSPISVLYRELLRELFPDTHYANDSGGEPYTIPELTYDYFKNFHKKYYSPSNAKIFLYGDLSINEQLAFIDEEYLSNFDRIDVDSTIHLQEPFAEERFVVSEYALASGEEEQDKDYFAWAVALNTYSEIKENFMLGVIADALFDSQSAPVKLALQEAELAQDINSFDEEMMQSLLAVILVNAKADAKEKLQSIVEDVLQKQVQEGIDRELLKASLNRFEYRLREGGGYNTPGIMYFIKVLDSWNYNGDPVDQLQYSTLLEELRESLNTDVWERFVKERILDNPHKLLLHLKPVAGLNEEKDKAVHAELQEKKAQMSDEEIANIVEMNRKLKEWQESEDSEEIKNTIPQLKLEDLNTTLPVLPIEVIELASEDASGTFNENDIVTQHALFTSEIHYGRMSFPMEHLEYDELFAASLLTYFLGSVNTDNYSYQKLNTAIYLATGGISFHSNLGTKKNNDTLLRMDVSWKVLDASDEAWMNILEELFTKTKFDDEKRVLELLNMIAANKEQELSMRGNSYAGIRAMANLRLEDRIQDEMNGVAFYLQLKSLIKTFEEKKHEFIETLQNVYKKIFARGAVILSLATDDATMEDFADSSVSVLRRLAVLDKQKKAWKFTETKKNEGIQVSSNVQYVVKAYDFSKLNTTYSGMMQVLGLLMSRNYLHNQIRAAGGAYGTSLSIARNNRLVASSYRDPHLTRTLEVYDKMGDWLRNIDLPQKEVEQYIIGSMNSFDPPLTARDKASTAFNRYVMGYSHEDLEKALQEALATKSEDLKAYAKLLDEAMQKNNFCIIGNSKILEENKDLFDSLIKL